MFDNLDAAIRSSPDGMMRFVLVTGADVIFAKGRQRGRRPTRLWHEDCTGVRWKISGPPTSHRCARIPNGALLTQGLRGTEQGTGRCFPGRMSWLVVQEAGAAGPGERSFGVYFVEVKAPETEVSGPLDSARSVPMGMPRIHECQEESRASQRSQSLRTFRSTHICPPPLFRFLLARLIRKFCVQHPTVSMGRLGYCARRWEGRKWPCPRFRSYSRNRG
jgi:hypothetical protein